MRHLKFISVLLSICIVCSCNSEKKYPKAENALDAGREFIDACLQGDFKRAAFYMVDDSTNTNLLLKQERNYKEKSKEEQQQYHDASIIINEDATIDDSTHIINYENSYDRIGRKVKVVLRNNTWLVDFKYTFNGNL